VLAKKGPLGKIWLAAHMGEKKVPKVQVVATNIPESIAHIENPSVRPRQSQRVAAAVPVEWVLVSRPRPHRHTPPVKRSSRRQILTGGRARFPFERWAAPRSAARRRA
jgi:hypothetical protein